MKDRMRRFLVDVLDIHNKEYAGLEDVVSDRFLASFLDMSPETLSRQKRCLREEKPD